MIKSKQEIELIAKNVVDSAFQVHKEMGPGLLESIYKECLIYELGLRKIKTEEEVFLPLNYKDKRLSKTHRIDILVEDEIIIEVKSVETLHPVFDAQIISYLKLTGKKLGFLINFNVPLIKYGIPRFVYNY